MKCSHGKWKSPTQKRTIPETPYGNDMSLWKRPESTVSLFRVAPSHRELFSTALKDSINRLFVPKIQRTIRWKWYALYSFGCIAIFEVFRRLLLARAEEAAISCFAQNLRHLFWREGVAAESVIALDPGYAACKAALLTSTGSSQIFSLIFSIEGWDACAENLLYNIKHSLQFWDIRCL